MTHRSVRVCIVGAGPRGLSVLERICANASDTTVDVHVVDPYPPGAGKVWRVDQDRHLLANTVASQVTMFTDTTVEMAGPVVAGPSLSEWAELVSHGAISDEIPDWARDEAHRTGPNTYPTRAFYGHYLRWVFRHIVAQAPDNVTVHSHLAEVVGVSDDERAQRIDLSDGSTIAGVDTVVLAQGHVGAEETPTERDNAEFARRHHLRYVGPANPADVDLSFVAAGQPVLLRGLGLCFFDYMSLLTAGRGGAFRRDGGRLVYEASGLEPRIYAGSRRGVPYHARGENQKGVAIRHVPLLLTPTVIGKLRAAGAEGNGIDFRHEVWPMVAKEVETVYYCTLLADLGHEAHVDRFRADFLNASWGSAQETAVLEAYDVSVADRWSWRHIACPHDGKLFETPAAFHDWLLAYLRDDIMQARRGNVSSPLKAALDVLRDLRNEIRLIVDHSGLSGQSHRRDLDEWYTPLNAFLSIGPPTVRTEELLALIEAGVVTIIGPDSAISTDSARSTFVATSPAVSGSRVEASTLIEAHLGSPDLPRTTDFLMRSLHAGGQLSTHTIPDHVNGHHPTPGLAVTERPYHVIDAAGRPHPRRFAFGVPTESVHWVTAAGIRPGVNSVTLADADAIARTALHVHHVVPAGSPVVTRLASTP